MKSRPAAAICGGNKEIEYEETTSAPEVGTYSARSGRMLYTDQAVNGKQVPNY